MIRLNIWLTLPEGETCLAGELVAADPEGHKGSIRGEFRYEQAYLDRPDAFLLDPNALPLTPDIFPANRPKSGVHGVFEDALPDDWGRRLLVRKYNLPRQEQRVPNLLAYLGQGLGALGFARESVEPQILAAPLHSLTDLLNAAQAFETGDALEDDTLAQLFQAGSSPGGARPKALIQDAGTAWIAKFPSVKDQYDVVALETATLQLASDAGITVPEFRCHPCGDRKVLLSKRFDVIGEGRRHVISMQSLLQADDFYMLGYEDMANVLRRFSDRPGNDLNELYRRMVFNVLVGNTDDHLKNFAMMHDDQGYQLSPAYDLVPNMAQNREHVLRFGLSASPPKRNELVQISKQYNLQPRQAKTVIDEVANAVSHWEKVFEEYEVPPHDVTRLRNDIEARLVSCHA